MEQPKWHSYMIIVMNLMKDGAARSRWEIIDEVAKEAKLTPELMAERNAAGDLKYANRIGWAISYLKNSGLLLNPSRSNYIISEDGKKHMASNPTSLSEKDLKKYPKYQEFVTRKRKADFSEAEETVEEEASSTPEEMIDSSVQDIKDVVCLLILNLMTLKK